MNYDAGVNVSSAAGLPLALGAGPRIEGVNRADDRTARPLGAAVTPAPASYPTLTTTTPDLRN